jgi:hypothetical protein
MQSASAIAQSTGYGLTGLPIVAVREQFVAGLGIFFLEQQKYTTR